MVRNEKRRLHFIRRRRYIETVMRDTSSAGMHEVLLFNRIFNPCSMTKGRWYAIQNNETAKITTGVQSLLKLSDDRRRTMLANV